MNAWSIALDSIWRHKLRSTLTALGVVIGVFAVVTLTSLGAGVKSYITGQFNRLGATLITVMPAAPGAQAKVNGAAAGRRGGGGGPGNGGYGFLPAPSTLTVADAQAIAALHDAHVAGAAPVAQAAGLLAYGSASDAAAPIVGTTDAYFAMQRLKFAAGGVPAGFADGIVLGHAVASALFGGAAPSGAVGRSVSINGTPFPVVGVLRAVGNNFGTDPDRAVFIPVARALALSGTRHVAEILVQADGTGTVTAASQAVQRLLDARHPVHDFVVVTAGQILSTIQSTLSVITSVLGGIAAISLVVGGIGIMNIMLVTVTERVREIGVRKALGARDRDILVQFLVESVLLALLGGAVGTLCSALAGRIVGNAIHVAIGLTGTSVGVALGFSILVGAVFGVLPAMNASRLMPADALRSE